LKIGKFDTENHVFVIAEIGNNHEGDFTRAQEMIREAARTGVDAVKFQPIVPEKLVTSVDVDRLKQLKSFQLDWAQYEALSEEARSRGVIFFTTPFDLDSVQFLNTLQPLFKIASGDNTFFPLIESVASFGKPAIISTGLADLALLDEIYQIWTENAGGADLAFLHCVASYPVPLAQANLGAISTLKSRYPDVTIGYSDHTLGIEAATLAVGAGARIIEKHFTLDKNLSDFRDHQLSADPHEMSALVEAVGRANSLRGTGVKESQPCENVTATAIRRSIAAARDLTTGGQIVPGDLTWLRPGHGIAPGNEKELIGRRLRFAVRKGEIITPDMCVE
jgi:sialic acid synthase SpsE